jgi:hypothetical protein
VSILLVAGWDQWSLAGYPAGATNRRTRTATVRSARRQWARWPLTFTVILRRASCTGEVDR